MCYEKVVVKINIHVGDDDAGVEKPLRGDGKRVRVRLTILFFLDKP